MSGCAIDIETVSLWDSLSGSQQFYVTSRDPECAQKPALNPQTSRVVCAAVWDIEYPDSSQCFYQTPLRRDFMSNNTLVACSGERNILISFWEKIRRYDRIVTWNGFRFDNPFLHRRSLVHGIAPSRELISKWYEKGRSMDLKQELSMYGHIRQYGLDFACQEFGIESPKGDLDGSKVEEYFKADRTVEIAEYCLGDAKATAALYMRLSGFLWRKC